MSAFFITFGQKSPFRYGWVKIVAGEREAAHAEANRVLGEWSSLYDEADVYGRNPKLTRDLFPDGQIGRTIEMPEGYRHR